MSTRLSHILIALSGIIGIILLGTYFGVGFILGLAQLPPDATTAQVMSIATQDHDLLFLGTWLQGTGSLLSVIFFLALAHKAGGMTRLAGTLTLLGSAVLLAVVLIEGVFTIDMAQAAANGHQATALTSFDLMTVFTYIYPIAPAPVIFLSLGSILLGSRLLPRAFSYLALGLGIVFEIVGFVSLFTIPALSVVALALQSLWVLAAAIVFLVRGASASEIVAVQERESPTE